MKNIDKIKAHLKIEKKYNLPPYFKFHLEINDVEIRRHTDFAAIILNSGLLDKNIENMSFEPYICNCGVSGCNGIFEPISSKFIKEKKVVEWKVPKNSGYNFLDKDTYYFSIEEFEKMIVQILYFIGENDAAFIDKEEASINIDYEDGKTLMELLDDWAVDSDFKELMSRIYEIQKKYPKELF